MGKEPEVIEYPEECPVCGGTERIIAQLTAQEIDKGINANAIPRYLYTFQFVMRNPNQSIIIGSKAPGGNIFIDVCKGCGILRAMRIEIGEAMAFDRPFKG